jgi:hypothetical protein
MEDSPNNKTGKSFKPQITSTILAGALDSAQAHTSFGKLPLAREKTAPIYSFGTGTRDQLNKIFHSEELSASNGLTSPGPKYVVQDNKNFHIAPNFGFGKDPRVTLGKTKHYDHYDLHDTFTDPITASSYTKTHYGSIKFGTESRLPPPKASASPGPQYLPPHRLEVKTAPKYSLGARRTNPNGNLLENQVSTTRIVGPGSYVPEKSAYTSVHENAKKWSFPNGDKIGKPKPPVSKNQTYDTRSISCGPQMNSRRKSAPNPKIGTANREQVSKLGMFKDTMSTQPTRVRIPHPNF